MIEEHSSIAEKFLRKWFWLYLFSFILAPIWYIVKIIISHDLSVEEIWIVYWVLSLMVFLSSLNDFWMTESMNRFVPEYVEEKNYSKVKSIIFYALSVQFTTWFLIWALFFFWSDFIWEYYFKSELAVNVIKIFSFFFLWTNFFQVINTFFSAVQNTLLFKLTEFLRMLFILVFVVSVFFMDFWWVINYSYSWVLWLYFWIFIAWILFYFNYYKKYFYKEKIVFDKKLFWEIAKYSFISFLSLQASTILSQIDMQMIIYYLWARDAWYYTNYLSIIWIPFVIVWPIFWFLFPLFSHMSAKKEFDKIRVVKSVILKFSFSFAIAFNILFFIYAREIAYILFWEKFINSWVILQYSILFLIFNFLLQINFNILSAIWKVNERLKIILVAIVFNVVLNYFLIKTIWVAWAALATWAWWILIWFLSELKLSEFRVKFDYKYFFKNFLSMWILWVLFYFLPINLLEIDRLKSFFILAWLSTIFFIIFTLINIQDFKYIFAEAKKLKK